MRFGTAAFRPPATEGYFLGPQPPGWENVGGDEQTWTQLAQARSPCVTPAGMGGSSAPGSAAQWAEEVDVLRLVGEQLRVHGTGEPAPAAEVEADRASGRSG